MQLAVLSASPYFINRWNAVYFVHFSTHIAAFENWNWKVLWDRLFMEFLDNKKNIEQYQPYLWVLQHKSASKWSATKESMMVVESSNYVS